MLLPASAFLLVLSEPVVRLIYQRGEFDAASTALTSDALLFFAIGLAFNGASLLVIARLLLAPAPVAPTPAAARGVLSTRPLRRPLHPGGHGRIPLGTSIASIVTFLVLLWLLERELGGLTGAGPRVLAQRRGQRRVGAPGVVHLDGARRGEAGTRRPRSSAWARCSPRWRPLLPGGASHGDARAEGAGRLRRPLR